MVKSTHKKVYGIPLKKAAFDQVGNTVDQLYLLLLLICLYICLFLLAPLNLRDM